MLPDTVRSYMTTAQWAVLRGYALGDVAEWLRSGLQNRLHQFNSGRRLHLLQVFGPSRLKCLQSRGALL